MKHTILVRLILGITVTTTIAVYNPFDKHSPLVNAQPEPTTAADPSKQLSPIPSSPKSQPQIADSIFTDVGQTITSFKGKTSQNIIIFPENHASVVGQIEIAIMLNRLYSSYGLRHLALEGAVLEEKIPDASWFHKLADASTRRDVALELLGQGEISAAEFAAMVFPDFQLHPIETKQEYQYQVSLSSDTYQDPIRNYLAAIAEKSLTPESLKKFNNLSLQGKKQEAINFAIDSNPWTKERYFQYLLMVLVRPLPSGTISLIDEVSAKAREVGANVSQYETALQQTRNFWVTVTQRDRTMVANTIPIVNAYPNAPIVMSVGAAHTEEITNLLKQKPLSFSVIEPLSLSNFKVEPIVFEGYERKRQGRSVDPDGSLGSFFDGRLKPASVLNEQWFEIKSTMMVTGTAIARAALENREKPLKDELVRLNIVDSEGKSGAITIDLSSIKVKDYSDGTRGVFFAVSVPSRDKKVWMGVRKGVEKNPSEATLEELLQRQLKMVNKNRQEQPVEEQTNREKKTAPLAFDVTGSVSENPEEVVQAMDNL